jgi:predicted HicB family RNase H-like nuclease
MAGSRADDARYAERVNAAADLIEDGRSAADAAVTLASRFGVSVRQARRYVDRASVTGRRPVPEASVVFTVKLPASLAGRVRQKAARSGTTISATVTEALTEYLSRGRGRGPRG